MLNSISFTEHLRCQMMQCHRGEEKRTELCNWKLHCNVWHIQNHNAAQESSAVALPNCQEFDLCSKHLITMTRRGNLRSMTPYFLVLSSLNLASDFLVFLSKRWKWQTAHGYCFQLWARRDLNTCNRCAHTGNKWLGTISLMYTCIIKAYCLYTSKHLGKIEREIHLQNLNFQNKGLLYFLPSLPPIRYIISPGYSFRNNLKNRMQQDNFTFDHISFASSSDRIVSKQTAST